MPIHRPGQTVSETPSHVLTLPLEVEPWQTTDLDKTFEAARLLYNSLVRHFLKQYELYQNSRQYKISTAILENKKSTDSQKFRARRVLNALKDKLGLSRTGFESKSAKLCGGWLTGRLYSMVRQKVANDCWAAFSKLLSGKGKQVKFKSYYDKEATLRNKWIKGDFRYDNGYFICNNLTIPVKFPKNDPYVTECMTHRIKYCGLSRRVIRGKVRYYISLYLEGVAPMKMTPEGELKHPVAFGSKVGIDIGTQTVTLSSRNGVWGGVLAAEIGNVQAMQNKLRRINRAMDRSRRATNPWAFDQEGKIVSIDKVPTEHKNEYGRRKWTVSKRYETLKAKRKELYRKQAAVRRLSHQMLVYKVLSFGTDIHVEKMNFAALAKRAKETKKSKKTGKFLSKKRSGKSLANRAPAMFIEMLQLKVVAVGGTLHKSNTYKIKASQIDHQTKECVKKTLDQRYHHLQDGTKIQRDFYSAFIEEHVDEANNVVDFEACNRDFPNFYKMYQVEMNRLTAYEGYLPSSLGIKRNPHERKNLRPQECSNNQQPQIA